MIKFLKVLLVLLMLTSCVINKEEKFQRDKVWLYKELSNMTINDQRIRLEIRKTGIEYDSLIFGMTNQKLLDSGVRARRFYWNYVRNDKDYNIIINNAVDKVNKGKAKEFFIRCDSLYKEMTILDQKNNKKLLKIVKKYGYPSCKRFGKEQVDCDVFVAYVFLHTLKKTHVKELELIKKEYELGRCPDLDYNIIMRRIRMLKRVSGKRLEK